MYNFINAKLPRIFDDFFVRNNNIHEYNVRNAGNLHVPFARLDLRKFSTRISGSKTWNSIPCYVKESSSLDLFKQKLKMVLIEKSVIFGI